MTPRDNMDVEEQRSHSTTPRATSPMSDSAASPIIPPSLVTSLLRQSTRSTSPQMFLQRSPTGRYTPEDLHKGNELSTDFEFPPSVGRRRPASPLSGPAYQPMMVSSRPSAPSNITWTASPPSATARVSYEHNRNGSWFSDGSSDMHGAVDSPKIAPRSLKSPALPDSPTIGGGHATMASFSSNLSSSSSFENRPPSSMSGLDLSSSTLPSPKTFQAPTGTQNGSRSPTSPDLSPANGSRRSSRQNPPSSPFALSSFPPLMFSPIASSSRSSLESAGSSYHSWEGEPKDRTYNLFHDTETRQASWHEISSSDQSPSTTPAASPGEEWEAEEVITRYAGLNKSDFMAIQGRLVGAALAKNSPDRTPSIRRRRPSTSQSNYSIAGVRV